MNTDTFIEKVSAASPKKLSKVKVALLRILHAEYLTQTNDGWVQSSNILRQVGQKYFDRRLRELRDELGCNIESNASSWRLSSESLNPPNIREYLTAKEKRDLFAKSEYRCQICGRQFQAKGTKLQADHKVPLSRQGGHEVSNWQAICVPCNVGKRRACEGCKAECESCPWAYPEKGISEILILPTEILNQLNQLGLTDPQQRSNHLKKIIIDHFKSSKKDQPA